MKKKFTVYGMTCSACVAAVERSVKKIDGVTSAGVNLSTGALICDCAPSVSDGDVINAVVKAGYKAEPYTGDKAAKNDLGIRFFVSLPFMLMLFYLCMGGMIGLPAPSFLNANEHPLRMALVQAGLFLPIGIVNYKYFTVGFKRLFKLSPNMDSLIATGALACLIYSVYVTVRIANVQAEGAEHLAHAAHLTHSLYYESAAMIFTLVTLGKFLEEKSKRKTGDALKSLKDLLPKTANLVGENGKITETPVSDIKVGDKIAVKEGESVCLDGVVFSGEASVNQAAITGESIPVFKKSGDDIISGGVVEKGYLVIKVTQISENSTLSRIITMVEEAGASKAPVSKLADKIAAIFVPSVIGVALLVFVIWLLTGAGFETAFNHGVSVLVVSCPCALGLATPLAVMLGTGKSAEHGVLIRSGEALQKLASINAVAFDKTGTLTEGKPQVTAVKYFGDKTEALETACFLESKSSHPLAKAVCDYCSAQGVYPEDFSGDETIENMLGSGVSGEYKGEKCYAVSYAYMRDNGLIGALLSETEAAFNEFALSGATPIFIVKNGKPLAALAIKDEVKQSAKTACKQLLSGGYKVIMITGDNEITAKAVAGELGIEYIAGVLPGGKKDAVDSLKKQGFKVAFVGDGINDAPALASADVGFAVGGGTGVAISNADVILMKNEPSDAVFALNLGKRSLKIIKQNLFWAFFYNCLCIPLAAGALSFANINFTPGFAALMMSLSSLFVVSNSLRLSLFGGKVKKAQVANENKTCEKGVCALNSLNGENDGQNYSQNGNRNGGQTDAQTDAANNNLKKVNNDNINDLSATENSALPKEKIMKKYIYVNGMMCGHCKARVEKTLSGLAGVKSAVVELENKRAVVEVTPEFDENAAKQAITDIDYEFVKVENA